MNSKRISSILLATFLIVTALANAHDDQKIKRLVKSWANAHNNWDVKKIKTFYALDVKYYGAELPLSKCISDKLTYFAPKRSFSMKVLPPIEIADFKDGLIKCEFTKVVSFDGKTKEYPAYLILSDDGNNYEIVGESDKITDKNIGKSAEDLFTEKPSQQSASMSQNNDDNHYLLYALLLVGITAASTIYFIKKAASIPKQTSPDRTVVEPAPPVQQKQAPTSVQPNDQQQAEAPNQPLHNVGKEFEKFVIRGFRKEYFKWEDWTKDAELDGQYPTSNMHPDLLYEFQHHVSKKLAIECKFRTVKSNLVDICKEEQLLRYKQFGKEKGYQVYLFLGVNHSPSDPKHVFIIPINKCKPQMTMAELQKFERRNKLMWFYNGQLGLFELV